MGTVFVSVLVHHPLEHLSTSVVIEVRVDIRQRDTVGIEESLKQQIVLHGVELGDAQAIGHYRTGRRTTSRTNPYAQLLAETHRLHDVKFKAYAVIHFLVQGVSIQACSTLVGQFVQIVSLKLDAVNLVVSAQLLYLLLSFLRWQLVLTVLIAGELLEEILLAELSSPLLFGAKVLGDREERHDGIALYVVGFHLVEHLAGVCQSLGNVLEHFVHLLARLEPLLFGVQHTRGVVQILAGGQAEQMVMRFGIILVHEVAVVGADELDAVFAGQFYEPFVGFLL